MDLEIGIVCARCDRYAPMGSVSCVECQNPLALVPAQPAGGPAGPVEPTPFTQPPMNANALPRLKVPVAEPASVPRRGVHPRARDGASGRLEPRAPAAVA
jgi:hypothetical protein